LRPRKTNLNYG